MKTCIVTTAWLDNEEYRRKTIKFINYYVGLNFADNYYVLDNGSINNYNPGGIVLKQLPHLPRSSHLSYPYLWRAFYSLKSFLDMGYERVIYMDNDFYIISPEMRDWVFRPKGLTSPWCNRHGFPETGLQILTKDCKEYINFVEGGEFWRHNGKTMETTLPLTEVRKDLIGDRWAEYGIMGQKTGWDFAAQVPLNMEIEFGK